MKERVSYEFKNKSAELRRLEPLLLDLQQNYQLSDQVVFDLNLTLEEVLTNTIFYGYPDKTEKVIWVHFDFEPALVEVNIEDDAAAFNPLESVKEPDFVSDIFDRPVGGLGVFLVKKLMREVSYRRENEKNLLRLVMSLDAATA
jgi:anti-sigma regulatory factor (Ser/Thr protein kinase)